jgi:hypothetical protein
MEACNPDIAPQISTWTLCSRSRAMRDKVSVDKGKSPCQTGCVPAVCTMRIQEALSNTGEMREPHTVRAIFGIAYLLLLCI